MAKQTVKQENDLELIENPDALAERLTHGSEDFIKKNKNVLLGVFAAIALAIVGAFLFYNYKQSKSEEAQAAMYQAIYYFEADSLNKAMQGDGQFDGFAKITEDYSGTDAGNLANFYAGVASLKQGKFQEAIDYLEDFSSDDIVLQGKAYCLIGDANMELGNKEAAADMYMKAADYKENKSFTPQYLMKAGMAYESLKNFEKANETYDKILTKYPQSVEANDAKKYKARAETLATR